MREHATHERGENRTRVTIAGKTTTRTDFDAKRFAKVLVERRSKKRTLAEREVAQGAMEAKVARH